LQTAALQAQALPANLNVQATSLLCFLLALALQALYGLVCRLHIHLELLQLILQAHK
jgi:hypothetical protein